MFRCVKEKRERIRKADAGFTLIETLTVLAIIAILTANLVPVLNGFISDARKKAYVAETYLVKTAAQSYVIENNARGTLDEFTMFEEIFQYEVNDPENALYELLKGSVTKGAVIKGINFDINTSKVSGLIYCVKKYEIEIKNDSEVEVRDRK